MRKIELIISFVLALCYISASCQKNPDIINLMNGQTFEGTIHDTVDGKITMTSQIKSKTKKYMFDHYRVYSIVKANEPEFVFYKKDTTIGNFLTPEEMKYYFFGEKDARKNYNPVGTKIIACLATFGVSLADTYQKDTISNKFIKGFFKSEPGLISLVAPFAITALAGFPAVQININKVSNRHYLDQQPYVDGFEKIGRSKKVFGALKFSLIGGALGFISYFIGR